MVKSRSSSCFNILACGSDSAAIDDLDPTESKASTDKRGWSFRKRSSRHRVLSNTVIMEQPSTSNKESPDANTTDFHAQTNSSVPEKFSLTQWTDETPPLSSTEVNSKIVDTLPTTEDADNLDLNLQETVVIVIQAAIRGYLARRALCKLKSVVKLQAVVRGHLVRRQAVGSLRCVQAIVKMQALVRARRVRMSVEGLAIQEKLDGKCKKNNQSVTASEKENSGTEANKTYSSTEKFLVNGFARQLLESTPKTKPIHISCDPSKRNSSWNWLERWMSVSSTNIGQPQKSQLNPDYREGESTKLVASEVGTQVQAEVVSDLGNLNCSVKETKMPLEDEENMITYSADSFDFQACHRKSVSDKISDSSKKDDLVQPRLEDAALVITQETSTKIRNVLEEAPNSLSNLIALQSDPTSQSVLDSISDKPNVDSENPKCTMKRVASEQLETEGKKFAFGPRKAFNPAFVAAQSKFEELSSTTTLGNRSISSTYHYVAPESQMDSIESQIDSVSDAKDLGLTAVSYDSRIQIGGSECGTELSITSTLDSPDRSEVGVGGGEFVHEIKAADKGSSDPEGTADNISNHGNLDADANNCSYVLKTLQNSSAYPISGVNTMQEDQQPSDQNATDMQSETNTLSDRKVHKSSPEGSPRSQITAPESHGTPSSQTSLNPKMIKQGSSLPTQKRRSRSVGKRSPPNQNHEAARNSMEQLRKDPKSGKGHNSFDRELRGSSSNSLPSYMQATESAKAKANANSSPKSSPDVLDKDIYIKKRHSLPATNGKQISPRMNRSPSQAQQGAKGKDTHSPQTVPERKWQR
eukprot:TRINITY_DN2552_c0_g1_i1.p1 TRINITY_DN2552_c0_g1~~TRINITY_DN2552_c0_g1_i1.p1  ORF type:complete len:811 (+),score=180.37 TRINITY_DN2552_c0_g1_i1:145-2577(+)